LHGSAQCSKRRGCCDYRPDQGVSRKFGTVLEADPGLFGCAVQIPGPLNDSAQITKTDGQSDQTLSETRKGGKKPSTLSPHTTMCEYLMMYEGLVLYVKEMDEDRYQRLCSVGQKILARSQIDGQSYMSTISSLHQSEIKDMLLTFLGTLKATATGEPNEACELLARQRAVESDFQPSPQQSPLFQKPRRSPNREPSWGSIGAIRPLRRRTASQMITHTGSQR
jgi:hypothetical protein